MKNERFNVRIDKVNHKGLSYSSMIQLVMGAVNDETLACAKIISVDRPKLSVELVRCGDGYNLKAKDSGAVTDSSQFSKYHLLAMAIGDGFGY